MPLRHSRRILCPDDGRLLPGAEQRRRVEPLGNFGTHVRDSELAIGLAVSDEGERDACHQSQQREHEPHPHQDEGGMEAVGLDRMAAPDLVASAAHERTCASLSI